MPTSKPPRLAGPVVHTWVGSVVIDCTELQRMVDFWRAALHYVPREAGDATGTVLVDPAGRGPNLSLNLSSEGPADEYRLHLDLYSTEPQREVERLLGLGATLVKPAEDGLDFITLADPDGNLFCVIDKRGWTVGQRS